MKRKLPSLDKRYSRNRHVSPEEKELWKQETQGEALPPRKRAEAKSKAIKASAKAAPPSTPRKKETLSPEPLDSRTRSKIHRDIMTPGATLDLHGHTRISAHTALLRFITDCQEKDIRLALIITGKGRIGEGVLRTLLPRWFDESPLRGRIIAYDSAGPRHGGEGAWYVRIRKLRERE